MSNSNRMSQILHRMLRKNEEQVPNETRGLDESKLTKMSKKIGRTSWESGNRLSLLSRKSSFSRQSCKKFSELPTKPIKVETLESPSRPIPQQPLNIPTPSNTPSRMTSIRKAKTLPASLANSPNVERIVQEFENGFMSPRSGFEPGSGNFVKRIVAAFEEKYNTYNDTWSDQVRTKLKNSGLHRHSYSNICQSLHFTATEICQSSDSLSTHSSSYETLKVEYRPSVLKNRDSDFNVECRQSGLNNECRQSGLNNKYRQSTLSDDYGQSALKSEYRQSNITNLNNNNLQNDSNCPKAKEVSDSTLERKERAPIIIGAFLKKPVKIEEVSVNWIPLPGKKLPRKKSLKKLLSVLSGKKCNERKKEVVFSSQVNVSEEARELPDSGYDEQSLSSSSLTSITSSAELASRVKKQEERIYANSSALGNWPITASKLNKKSTNLSTFQSRGPNDLEEERDICSAISSKLLLYEVPREEVKVDLGPCYPSPSRIMVKSLDRKIPDNFTEEDDNGNEEVVLRKPKNHSFHSSDNEYDIPRNYLSRSEPGISEVLRFSFDLCLDETSNYDVPKLRPKSSLYEDALSLKRRNADFVNVSGSSQDYYSSPSPPQYATIKSRKKRYLNPDICRSTDELRTNCQKVTSF